MTTFKAFVYMVFGVVFGVVIGVNTAFFIMTVFGDIGALSETNRLYSYKYFCSTSDDLRTVIIFNDTKVIYIRDFSCYTNGTFSNTFKIIEGEYSPQNKAQEEGKRTSDVTLTAKGVSDCDKPADIQNQQIETFKYY